MAATRLEQMHGCSSVGVGLEDMPVSWDRVAMSGGKGVRLGLAVSVLSGDDKGTWSPAPGPHSAASPPGFTAQACRVEAVCASVSSLKWGQ